MELHRHGLPVEAAIEPGLIALADAARHSRWSPPTTATSPNPPCTRRTTRCCASPRAACCPSATAAASRPEHWFKPAAGDARAVRRPAGGLRQHARHRAPLRGHGRNPQAAAAGLPEGPARQHRGGNRARHGRPRAWSAGWTPCRPTRPPASSYRERLAYELDVIAGWVSRATSSSSPTSSSGRRRRASRSVPAAVPAPARSSPGR